MRVLVLRHHAEDRAGFVGDALLARGADLADLLLTARSSFPDPAAFAAIVVLGAADSAYDPQALSGRIADELAFLRSADAAATPMLGICFGAQALCAALGGTVEPMPRMEIGWRTIETSLPDLVAPGPWLEFHGDHCAPPPEAEVVARTAACVQAFTLGPHLGVQFHPEVDAAQLQAWFDAGSDDQVVAHGLEPATLLAETAAQEEGARYRAQILVDAFLGRL
ncbi:MAG: gamma-glutamyl-gamma-aminobutyrate hydrolase family protein [Acidimicrobiales bacterium]